MSKGMTLTKREKEMLEYQPDNDYKKRALEYQREAKKRADKYLRSLRIQREFFQSLRNYNELLEILKETKA